VVWAFINDVVFAFYPIVVMAISSPLNELGSILARNRGELLFSAILLLALFIFPMLVGRSIFASDLLPLEYAGIKIPVLVGVGFLFAALPLSLGIWLVHIANRDGLDSSLPLDQAVKNYVRYRTYLQQFLLILAILLSLYMLASAALRNVVIASEIVSADGYPAVYLLLLGAYYALFSGLIYFPAYATLLNVGNQLLEAAFPLPAPDSDLWAARYARRNELEALLELKITGEQRVLTIITVIAPFVTGIFSVLV
jgi:hypothetical protein